MVVHRARRSASRRLSDKRTAAVRRKPPIKGCKRSKVCPPKVGDKVRYRMPKPGAKLERVTCGRVLEVRERNDGTRWGWGYWIVVSARHQQRRTIALEQVLQPRAVTAKR